MKNKLEELLDEKIEAELNALDDFDPASEERGKTVDNVVKLYKLKNDATKFERYVKLGAEIAGIVLPLAFYGSWMRMGLKFEETGSIRSTAFKSFFTHLKPKK